MTLPLVGKVLANCPGQEQDEDNGGSDPEWTVEIGVAVQDVEEIGTWVESCTAPAQNFCGVDIEELGIEGETPKESFGAKSVVVRLREGIAAQRWEFGSRRRVFEVCGRIDQLTVREA